MIRLSSGSCRHCNSRSTQPRIASSSTTELIDSRVCAVGGGPACMPMAMTNSPNTTRSMPTVTPYNGASGAMAKVSHSNGTGIAWIR